MSIEKIREIFNFVKAKVELFEFIKQQKRHWFRLKKGIIPEDKIITGWIESCDFAKEGLQILTAKYEQLEEQFREPEESPMMECWMNHPIDDKDCEQCPNMKECREIREKIGQLETLVERQRIEIERLKNGR
jgi:hypothetical protein